MGAPVDGGIEEEVVLVDPGNRWAVANRIDDVRLAGLGALPSLAEQFAPAARLTVAA